MSVGVGRVWDCMLCTYVSKEGGDGEGAGSSLLSYGGRGGCGVISAVIHT
jgi:hypothetical protein